MSVGFDERTYSILASIAQEQDVAIAWVVRRAVAEFVGRQSALGEPELLLRRVARRAMAAPDV